MSRVMQNALDGLRLGRLAKMTEIVQQVLNGCLAFGEAQGGKE